MILSDRTLRRLISAGELLIEPFNEECLQCSSIDLRLGDEIGFYEGSYMIDIKKDTFKIEVKKIEDEFVILPRQFVLATTLEYIKLPDNVTAFVEGRSSLGRLGLFIENAGWVDAGFEGQITLELFNANKRPIKLYKGMRICQLVFARLDERPSRSYSGKYKGQRGVTPSRIFMDSDIHP